MPWSPRRVVTGHDDAGHSVILSDAAPPITRTAPDGALFHELWATDEMPAPLAAAEPDPTERSLTVPPSAHGTKIRVNEFPPGTVSPTHRTQSVDYGIVLAGEVTLVVGETETVLRPGDVVVQRGTDHRWENRGTESARMVFVLVSGQFTPELLDAIGHDVLPGLLDDPINH